MNYEKSFITMSDGKEIMFHSWTGEEDPKAVVVISHGMAEHVGRYAAFAEHLVSRGFAVFGEDHRGHGLSAVGRYGYLADRKGFFRVVDDIHEEILSLRERYPDAKFFLFGHSFGSFISQCYIEKYASTIDGCILCGTAGPRKALIAAGHILAGIVSALGGKKRPSKLLNAMAFGSYNKRIPDRKTDFDWLSRDEMQVNAYMGDGECGFLCTGGFFCDMFSGFKYIHKNSHIKEIPEGLPLFFIAGTADPVGSYGQTVEDLVRIYRDKGIRDVELKLYEGARHELLNETNRAEVIADITTWLENHC